MTETPCSLEDGACDCLLSETMELLGRKYAMEVVCVVAAHGRVRFGDIEAHLPAASTSTLSDRLDELAAAGLVVREQFAEVPPRVEYELTEAGERLGERLEPLLEWAQAHDAG